MSNWIIEKLHSKDCRVCLVSEMTTWSQPWYFPRIRDKGAEFLTFDGFLEGMEPIGRDQVEAITQEWDNRKPEESKAFDGRSSAKNANSPIGKFNAQHDDPEKWRELLEKHGFQLIRTDKVNGSIAWRYLPPSSTTKQPGVHVYRGKHDGALLITSHNGSFQLPHKACDFFGLWTHLEHARDTKAAEAAIGIKPRKPTPEPPIHIRDEASATSVWEGWQGSWPEFHQDRNGIMKGVTNIRMALECPSLIGMKLAYDQFTDNIMFARRPGEWEPANDALVFELRQTLERFQFKNPCKADVQDALHFVGFQNRMDTAMEWIKNLPQHDGVQRLNTFFHDYFGAEQNLYTMGLGRYIWTAMAGRILYPGIKADNVPVLVGPQGIRKSSAVEAMAPSRESFMILSLAKSDADISRMLRGIVLGEWGELAGMKPKEVERVKNFCTQTHEQWIPKWKEYGTTMPRRCMFVATTNEEQFLADPTGNRRFFPVKVTWCDSEAIAQDRDQLWAEAVGLFKANGIEWKGVTELGATAQRDHEVIDPWQPVIAEWLKQPISLSGEGVGFNADRKDLDPTVILDQAIHMPFERHDDAKGKRVGAIMRKLGFDYRRGIMTGPKKRGNAYRRKD
jgi:predicted P-loop ATPase